MRKAEAMNATLEEDRQEWLMIMAARAQAQEAMKLRQLVGEGKTDTMAEAASSSLVTSQALRPPMLSRSPTTPRAATPVPPQAHAVPVWKGTIVIVGAVVDDGQGCSVTNRP
jgi:hypothetical protein